MIVLPDNTEIVVTALNPDAGRQRIGIEAPQSIRVWRREVLDRIRAEEKGAKPA